MKILKVKCSKCNQLIEEFYSSDSGWWWDKFISEGKELCLTCARKQSGFSREFHKQVGISVKEYLKKYYK